MAMAFGRSPVCLFVALRASWVDGRGVVLVGLVVYEYLLLLVAIAGGLRCHYSLVVGLMAAMEEWARFIRFSSKVESGAGLVCCLGMRLSLEV
jgi:hypothetical protein